MTLDEYVKNRDDMTAVAVVESASGFEIMVRLDGSYTTREQAEVQAKFIGKTLGIRVV